MELGVPFGSIQGIELSTALGKRLVLKLGMGLGKKVKSAINQGQN